MHQASCSIFIIKIDLYKKHAQSLSLQCHWFTVVDPGGAAGSPISPPPERDPILSYLHLFLPKSAHIGGRRPTNGSEPYQWEILDPQLVDFSSLFLVLEHWLAASDIYIFYENQDKK